MKIFQLFTQSGSQLTIEADSATVTKKKDGLEVKFFKGKKVSEKHSKAVCFFESTPAITYVPEVQENQASGND